MIYLLVLLLTGCAALLPSKPCEQRFIYQCSQQESLVPHYEVERIVINATASRLGIYGYHFVCAECAAMARLYT